MSKKIYTADDIKLVKADKALSDKVDISRGRFKKNLESSSQHALDFTRSLVVNSLPDQIKYTVFLGASYDGNPLEDGERVFPEDYSERERAFANSEEVVELLWRDGTVPEWINVSVVSEDGEHTLIKLECCGRYSGDVKHMYHAHEGRAPFHVIGPPVPLGYEEAGGGKFDLYWSSTDS